MRFYNFFQPKKDTFNLAFIFGCPRSGTTWLWSLLESHPDVIPFVNNKKLNGIYASSESGIYTLKNKNPKKELRSFCLKYNDKLVVEKTPVHTLYYDKIVDDFPHSKAILIFRNPLAILSSMLHSKMDAFKGYDYLRAITEIKKYYKQLIRISKSQQVYHVTYENLYANTEAQLTSICTFLDLKPSDISKIIEENSMKTKVSVKGALRKAQPNSYKKDLNETTLRDAVIDLKTEMLYFNALK